jgi:predicted transcriptional regulator of viral defense system
MKRLSALSESNRALFDVRTLGKLYGVKPASARVLATRLVRQGTLVRLRRNLYVPTGTTVFPFEVANALFEKSYVSFESALNYWGVIVQVPMTVTSAASRSFRAFVRGQEFMFRRLPSRVLRAGRIRDGKADMAVPEKALLDSLYLRSKGILGLEPTDIYARKLNRRRLESLINVFPAGFSERCAGFLSQLW